MGEAQVHEAEPEAGAERVPEVLPAAAVVQTRGVPGHKQPGGHVHLREGDSLYSIFCGLH